MVEREIFFSVSMTRAMYIYIERERERGRERGRRCCGKSQSPKFFSSAFLCFFAHLHRKCVLSKNCVSYSLAISRRYWKIKIIVCVCVCD